MRFAPRYDARIFDALRALDDPRLPMAEVNRRVGARVAALGVPRPSDVHLRRLLIAERRRDDSVRAGRVHVAVAVAAGRWRYGAELVRAPAEVTRTRGTAPRRRALASRSP